MDAQGLHAVRPDVRQAVEDAMRAEPMWDTLQPEARESLAESLGAIAGQLAPAVPPRPSRPQPAAPAPSVPADGAQPPAGGGAASPTGRVGEVARATLNAIDFPSFVASLI